MLDLPSSTYLSVPNEERCDKIAAVRCPQSSNNDRITKNSLIKSLQKKQGGVGEGAMIHQPIRPYSGGGGGSLRALDKLPQTKNPKKNDEDEKSQVSFGTAARRFAQNQTMVSPEMTGVVTVAAKCTTRASWKPKTTKVAPTTRTTASPASVVSRHASLLSRQRPTPYNQNSPLLVPKKPTTFASNPKVDQSSGELASSKVLRKRFHAAATKLQRVVRGRRARQQYAQQVQVHRAATRLQAWWQQCRQRLWVQQDHAATQLQAVARRWYCRRQVQVYKLQEQLERIQSSQREELDEIQKRKQAEMAAIRQKWEQQVVETQKRAEQNAALLHKMETIVAFLRRENKKMRNKNEALKTAMHQMAEEHELLYVENAQVGQQGKALTNDMSKTNDQNAVILHVLREFQTSKDNYERMIAKRDEYIMFENRIGRLYLEAIQRIVLAVEEECDDPALVYFVEEMCLQNDKQGAGLDDSEREMSESNF